MTEWLSIHPEPTFFSFPNSRLNTCNAPGLYSFHSGITFLMGDGAARFLGEATDQAVVRGILTRDRGEVATAP